MPTQIFYATPEAAQPGSGRGPANPRGGLSFGLTTIALDYFGLLSADFARLSLFGWLQFEKQGMSSFYYYYFPN